jgi:hypothetical protein
MTEFSREHLAAALVHFVLLHFVRIVIEAGLWVASFQRTP